MESLKVFGITLLVFLAVDAVWLLGISKSLYQKGIGFLMPEQVSLPHAGVAYLLLALGLVFFVLMPGIADGLSIGQIALRGALFGFVAYGIYDFTNLATIKGWPLWISLVDMAWGTFASGVVSGISAYVTRLLG